MQVAEMLCQHLSLLDSEKKKRKKETERKKERERERENETGADEAKGWIEQV